MNAHPAVLKTSLGLGLGLAMGDLVAGPAGSSRAPGEAGDGRIEEDGALQASAGYPVGDRNDGHAQGENEVYRDQIRA